MTNFHDYRDMKNALVATYVCTVATYLYLSVGILPIL